ncbi:MAG: CopG family transcriptional regulator [Mycobacteriales bacterium]
MRTTLNLDEDVLLAVQERARREGRAAGQVLSELARQALNTPRGPIGRSRNGFPTLPHRGQAVSNALIYRLRDEDSE